MWRNQYNFILMDFGRTTKQCVHFATSVIGCGLTISGGIRKFSNKERHFVTQHGRLGG